MSEYLYKATTLSGQTVEGSMEGKDEEMVIKNLHQLGYIPIRIATAQEKELRIPGSSPFCPSASGSRPDDLYPGALHPRFSRVIDRPEPRNPGRPDGKLAS